MLIPQIKPKPSGAALAKEEERAAACALPPFIFNGPRGSSAAFLEFTVPLASQSGPDEDLGLWVEETAPREDIRVPTPALLLCHIACPSLSSSSPLEEKEGSALDQFFWKFCHSQNTLVTFAVDEYHLDCYLLHVSLYSLLCT